MFIITDHPSCDPTQPSESRNANFGPLLTPSPPSDRWSLHRATHSWSNSCRYNPLPAVMIRLPLSGSLRVILRLFCSNLVTGGVSHAIPFVPLFWECIHPPGNVDGLGVHGIEYNWPEFNCESNAGRILMTDSGRSNGKVPF
ncbi:hypothetical protein TNCV_766941 [Trichonephila clavipes]|nr:hypothetical protein TNCV_766941 [Trichonephila clavipes]